MTFSFNRYCSSIEVHHSLGAHTFVRKRLSLDSLLSNIYIFYPKIVCFLLFIIFGLNFKWCTGGKGSTRADNQVESEEAQVYREHKHGCPTVSNHGKHCSSSTGRYCLWSFCWKWSVLFISLGNTSLEWPVISFKKNS